MSDKQNTPDLRQGATQPVCSIATGHLPVVRCGYDRNRCRQPATNWAVVVCDGVVKHMVLCSAHIDVAPDRMLAKMTREFERDLRREHKAPEGATHAIPQPTGDRIGLVRADS